MLKCEIVCVCVLTCMLLLLYFCASVIDKRNNIIRCKILQMINRITFWNTCGAGSEQKLPPPPKVRPRDASVGHRF